MKRIMNGKIYDTDTAEKLTIRHMESSNLCVHIEIGRTPHGSYFRVINGKPIEPLTEKQARTAAEYSDQVTIEEYEAYFGPVTDA